MKAAGYFQPMPETQALWDELAIAKARRDRNQISALTDKIRRQTMEILRNDYSRPGTRQPANYRNHSIAAVYHSSDEGDW